VAGWRVTERDLMAYPKDVIDRLLAAGTAIAPGAR
jgi:hypothetical protein